MATITPLLPSIAGAVSPFAATVVGGDEVAYAGSGDLLIEFHNTHSAPITVTIAPTTTAGRVHGAGPVTIPSRSLAVPNAAHGAFLLKATEISAYINASGRIPLTYTSGNILLLARALSINP